MNKKSGIFIFTRDRPDKLRQVYNAIKDVGHSIIIIDDSLEKINQSINQEIIDASNHSYLGKQEFSTFIQQHKIDLLEFSFLVRQLGDIDWNLGYARNLGLIYGKALGLESILYMDDDIEVPNLSVIDELFELLGRYDFTGARIEGLVDDSILGHIATDLEIFNERMLSGGFMAFNPNNVDHYFLNNYNEDWIWLFLHSKEKTHFQKGRVLQALSDPLHGYENKIMFQEVGEIVLDGILDCYKQTPDKSLCSTSFWERILDERKEYLERLYEAIKLRNKNHYFTIVEQVMRQNIFSAEKFKGLFEKYFSNLAPFKRLLNSL